MRQSSVVGLDIGSSAVKMVRLVRKGGDFFLADLRMKEGEIASALKAVLEGVPTSRCQFIVSINSTETALRRITVPVMPREELKAGLRMEAKNYFPFPLEGSALDFEVVGETMDKGVRKYEVLVGVASKKTVEDNLSLLGMHGIRPMSLTPVAYALGKVSQMSSEGKSKNLCWVDIGMRYTELLISHGRGLTFSRKLPVAGEDFTKALTQALTTQNGVVQLSREEAEKTKREAGIPAAGPVLSMIRPPAEQLAEEIDRSFAYFREESGGAKVDQIILYGGGAHLKGLTSFLTERLQLEVKIGNPVEALRVTPEARESLGRHAGRLGVFAAALGAALGGGGLNLLPAEIKERTRRSFKRSGVEAAAITVTMTLLFFAIGIKMKTDTYDKKTAAAQVELSSFVPRLEEARAEGITRRALAGEPAWEEIFKDLSNAIPPDVYLTEMMVEDKTFRLRGLTSGKSPEEALSVFMRQLEHGLLKEVRLVHSRQTDEKTAHAFELEGNVSS